VKRIHPEIFQRARELRQPQTLAEQKLWAFLRGERLAGYKFRRQHPIGPFIVDFYCASCKLVVEVDGDSHAGQVEYDAQRTDWLEAQGYRVVRFTNQDVYAHTLEVLDAIEQACALAGDAASAMEKQV
jgi:very-short-patch-repair endonuclease